MSWHYHPIGIPLAVVLILAGIGSQGDPSTNLSMPQEAVAPAALAVKVTDGDTGAPLACTVQLVDAHGRVVTEGDGLVGAFQPRRGCGQRHRATSP